MDGGEVVIITRRQRFSLYENPDINFPPVKLRTIVLLEGLGKSKKKSNDLSGYRTRDLPACSRVS
jgi:hypothetical protein